MDTSKSRDTEIAARRKGRRRWKLSKAVFAHPVWVKVAALLASGLFRCWLATLYYRFAIAGPHLNPAWRKGPAIFVFWHEMLLMPAYTHARYNAATLVSRHRDGEFLTQVIRLLGGGVVRGSTRRKGAAALRQLLRAGRVSHLAIAPDGPKGPRRVVQPGVIYLAARAGMDIIPVGFAFENCWRAKSWDRLALPKPYTAAFCAVGESMTIPDGLSREQMQTYQDRLQEAMEMAQDRAEAFADGRRRPGRTWTLQQMQSREAPQPLEATI